MRYGLKPLFFLFSLFCIPLAAAQDATSLSDALPILERCVTIDNNPPDDWSFEGTIITYHPGNGVYGFRADTPSRYYIAFDSNRQFARDGTFSPDGQWFVSYWGRRIYANMMGYDYFASELVVNSVHPRRESYRIPFTDVTVVSQYPAFSSPVWLDNTRFIVKNTLVQPFEGKAQDLSKEETEQLLQTKDSVSLLFRLFADVYTNIPDHPPRAFLAKGDSHVSNLYISDPEHQQVYDTCLDMTNRQAYAISPTGDQLAVSIGGPDGFVYVFDLNDWTAYRLDLAANPVVAWFADS